MSAGQVLLAAWGVLVVVWGVVLAGGVLLFGLAKRHRWAVALGVAGAASGVWMVVAAVTS